MGMQLTSLLKACTVFAMQALIGIAASTATSVVTAASVKINMYLDSDRSSTGGCSVTTATRAITGIDYGLQFTIDDTAKTVSAVDVQNCQNGVLAKNHTAQGVWTYSSGTTADVIRGTIARSDFGGAAIFGTVIASTIDGQVQDVLDGGNSTGFAGFPILASDAAAIVASVPIPTLAQMALPILATLIGLFGMWCVYRKRDAAKNILNSVLIGGLALALAAPVQKVIAAVGTIVSYIDQPATTAANDVQRIRSGDVLNSSITLDPSTLTYAIEIQLRNPTMSNEALQIALLEQGQDFSPIAPSEDVDVVAPPPKTNTTFKGQKVAAGRIEIKANSSVSFDSMKSFVESKQWRIIGRDRVFDTYTVDLNGKLSVEEAVTLAKTSLLVKFDNRNRNCPLY